MDYNEIIGDSGKWPDFTKKVQAGHELLQLLRELWGKLGANRGLLDQYLAGIMQAMTDTTNAHLTARDGFESGLSPLRGILRQIKEGKIPEAQTHPFYPMVRAYIDAHPLPHDNLQYELYYLGLFMEFVPYAAKNFMDECDAAFKEHLAEENVTLLRNALLSSNAEITEENLNDLHGLISRAFVWISPSSIFMQGMVDQMLLSLIWQDCESGDYVFSRLIDEEG